MAPRQPSSSASLNDGNTVSRIYLIRHGDRFDYANPQWLDTAKENGALVDSLTCLYRVVLIAKVVGNSILTFTFVFLLLSFALSNKVTDPPLSALVSIVRRRRRVSMYL
jgi:hypothetical protein